MTYATYTTPTFITEGLHLVTCVQMLFKPVLLATLNKLTTLYPFASSISQKSKPKHSRFKKEAAKN